MARVKGTARTSGTSGTRHGLRSSTAANPIDTTAPEAEPEPSSALQPQPTLPPTLRRTRRRRTAGADPWAPRKRASTKAPRPRAPAPTHYTCRICAEEQPAALFIKWRANSTIYHRSTVEVPFPCIAHLCRSPRLKNEPVCKPCIGAAMAARLDTLGPRKVGSGCIEPGCETEWHWTYVLRYFPAEHLERYNHAMLPIFMEESATLTCVDAACAAVGLADRSASGFPQVVCHTCSARMCASCNVPWHMGVTCSEFSAARVDKGMTDPEKATLQIMQERDGKRCPNCHMVIEKDGGCDSMYCMGCRTYFNWATAASAVLGAKPAMPQAEVDYQMRRGCEVDNLAALAAGKDVAAETPAGRRQRNAG
ncbi:hypothetical protein BDV95DRAFT_587976 [Massariosphaeria phaeospora]|uniref:RBR-type E3 ubiquitin transferase n=1 Tax=Massariosphaeria phaeospora TaxID=100035 RepID=A0A7C8HYF0_9PLEO|nr:hypothetical protein BDV95DRAFT_587976 [Massariosphaeria phaeospora]